MFVYEETQVCKNLELTMDIEGSANQSQEEEFTTGTYGGSHSRGKLEDESSGESDGADPILHMNSTGEIASSDLHFARYNFTFSFCHRKYANAVNLLPDNYTEPDVVIFFFIVTSLST